MSFTQHKDDLPPMSRLSRWRQSLQNVKRDEWLIGIVVTALSGLPQLIVERLFNLIDRLFSALLRLAGL